MSEIKPFIPADAVKITGDKTCLPAAELNLASGPGFTIFDGKKILACGGVRIYGIGEAWFLMAPGNEGRIKSIMRQTRETLEGIQRDRELYKIYAENIVSETFIKHLGFEKKNGIFLR